jgi:hypothetical protein
MTISEPTRPRSVTRRKTQPCSMTVPVVVSPSTRTFSRRAPFMLDRLTRHLVAVTSRTTKPSSGSSNCERFEPVNSHRTNSRSANVR